MIKKIFFCFLFFVSVGVASEETSQDIGKEKAESLRDYFSSFSSSSGVENNLQTPLTSSNKLTTLDGSSSFNAQLSCEASNEYLRATIVPLSSGDVRFLAIEQDTTMDGNIDTVATPDWIVSGVCANGFIACSAGTWNACKNMIWTADSKTNHIGAYQGALTDLGGCYCINNSCGNGLAFSNLNTILNTLGSGMAGALTSNNPYYSIAGAEVNDTTIKYYGSDSASCSSSSLSSVVGTTNISDLTSYNSASANSLKNAGTTALSTSSLSDVVINSSLNGEISNEYAACSIKRIVSLDEVTLDDVIGFESGSGELSACGSDCLLLTVGEVGDDYLYGSCKITEQEASFFIKRPDRILAAEVESVFYEDRIQIIADNDLVYSEPNDWNSIDSGSGYCSVFNEFYDTSNKKFWSVSSHHNNMPDVKLYWNNEVIDSFNSYVSISGDISISRTINNETYRFGNLESSNNHNDYHTRRYSILSNAVDHNSKYPDIDILEKFSEEGSLSLKVRSEYNGYSSAYARTKLSIDTECKVNEDYISDSCTAYKENSDCILLSENVDGVDVYSNYAGTGLTPLASTQTITGSSCSISVTRDWFVKDRVYICKNDNNLDIDSILNRKSIVTDSANEGDTDIDDIRYDIDKGIVRASVNVTPYSAYEDGSCTQVCKTRKLIDQNSVSVSGVTGELSEESKVYEYSYNQCDLDLVCPVGEGEEVIQACSCSSDFSNATAIMQSLRLAGKDLMCTSGELQSME